MDAIMEDGDYLELACGNCQACRAKRVRSWAIRCFHESQMHTRKSNLGPVPNGCFITLTYDDEHLPNDRALDLEHWKLFRKRLYKRFGPFRFLHCGEYGSKNGRPHYHACLFGLDFHEDREVWRTDGKSVVWLSDTLSEIWGKGFTTLAPLNFATSAYVAGYVMKKAKHAEHLERTGKIGVEDGRITVIYPKPEYVTMSKKPGLGSTWFEKYWTEVYPRDRVTIEGREFQPPRFYDDMLLKSQPVLYDEVIARRREFLDKRGPTCDNELRARGELFAAKFARKPERM
ncbi:replication initiator protein [Microviridae sp.]|nr:replication initiator protein [Microviridae sp.]